MALLRGVYAAAFRGQVAQSIGPFQVTATIPSTAAGAVGGVQVAMPAGLNLLPGDVLLVMSPVTSRVGIEMNVDDSTHLSLVASNGSAGAFNPGSATYTVVGFRFKTA